MENEEIGTTDSELAPSKRLSVVVTGLAVIGAVKVGTFAADKLGQFRLIRKSKLDALKAKSV